MDSLLIERWPRKRTRFNYANGLLGSLMVLSLVTSMVGAATPLLVMGPMTLDNKQVQAQSAFSVSGSFENYNVAAGDCFQINRVQPYSSSQAYSSNSQFWVPFPSSLNPKVISSSSAATVTRIDDFTLQVTFTAAGTYNFNVKMENITNPYSMNNEKNFITMKYIPQCSSSSSPISCGTNTNCNQTISTSPYTSILSLDVPTSSISPAQGKTQNFAGSTNGGFVINLVPGANWPKFGGQIEITLPPWYDGTTSDLVFSSATSCSGSGLALSKAGVITQNKYVMIFSSFTGTSLQIMCTNFRNPTYAKTVGPFSIQILDNETPSFQIIKYPDWTMTIASGALEAVQLTTEQIKFQFYDGLSSPPYLNTVPIQTMQALEITFYMDTLPVDDSGCYVKYTFPSDMPIQANYPGGPTVSLTSYQAAKDYTNNKVMVMNKDASPSGFDLLEGIDVFNTNQNNNILIIKGCRISGQQYIGQGHYARVLLTSVTTPKAAKTTGDFTIEVYKNFDYKTNLLSDKIAFQSGSIPESKFISGTATAGVFEGLLKTVQQVSSHSVQWVLTNSIPKSDAQFTSRIVIKMPENMKFFDANTLNIKSLDGLFNLPVIKQETAYTGCSAPRLCYVITHSNLKDVPAGSTIKFRIFGTINQEAEMPAGTWETQTQLVGVDGKTYNMDFGSYSANNFIAKPGSVIQTSDTVTTPSSYTTWNNPVEYTFRMTLSQYVPQGGFIEIFLPPQITINFSNNQSPWTKFQSDDANIGTNAFSGSSVKLVAKGLVKEGAKVITIGAIQNPTSFTPTNVINVKTYNAAGQAIANGLLSNVEMNEAFVFSQMNITAENQTDGAITIYKVSFTPTVPAESGDIFTLNLPPDNSVKAPKQPQCFVNDTQVNCLSSVSCTAELGKLVIKLENVVCSNKLSNISFYVRDMENPPSQVPTLNFGASITSSNYYLKSQFKGTCFLQNKLFAQIDPKSSSLHQTDKNYEVLATYTVRFKPTNPINRIGAVRIMYPKTIEAAPDFTLTCQAQTALSYTGSKYCQIEPEHRHVWFFQIFQDSQSWTSEIALFMNFTNPVTNFWATLTEEEKAFQISTFTFDMNEKDFWDLKIVKYGNAPNLEQNQAFVSDLISIIRGNPDKYALGIDKLFDNRLQAELKCNQPCYQCLDTDPNFCTSCWGKGKNGDQTHMFLQTSNIGTKTCKPECDEGFTANGNAIETKPVNDAKTWYTCSKCDSTCKTCRGQFDKGQVGDIKKCLTCQPEFPWLVKDWETCHMMCTAGLYQKKVTNIIGAGQATQMECGVCKGPCQTCQSCKGTDKNCKPVCDKSKNQNPLKDNCVIYQEDAGADFCTSCDQTPFFPDRLQDIENVQEFFVNQIGMNTNSEVIFSAAQKAYFAENMNENTNSAFAINNFLQRRVWQLPNGGENNGPLTESGLIVPSETIIKVTNQTTYADLYKAQYNKFVFPKKSLFENQCVAFCPDGFANVNGYCLKCDFPCATCYSRPAKCTKCLQTNNEKKYIFGSTCYESCPDFTAQDEENMNCIGCESGCLRCDAKNTSICLECDRRQQLLLVNKTFCSAQCPENQAPNFIRTECVEVIDVKAMYFPFQIGSVLVFIICWMGRRSARNISGQHRILLSFYALMGMIDILEIWAFIILIIVYVLREKIGDFWHLVFPGVSLLFYYYLNFRWSRLCNQLDPPKPKDDDDLVLSEVKLINNTDEYYDRWNEKYASIAKKVRKAQVCCSHKIFHLSYTHFYGYLHFTNRIQDNLKVWEWDGSHDFLRKLADPSQSRGIVEKTAKETFRYHGKLVEKREGTEAKQVNPDASDDDLGPVKLDGRNDIGITPEDGEKKNLLSDDHYEGGSLAKPRVDFDPFMYVQSPEKRILEIGQPVPDNRIKKMFRHQMLVDFIGVRIPLMGGGILLLISDYSKREMQQLTIHSIEVVITGFIMIVLQLYLFSTWESQKLPFKMRDTKHNYLFKPLRFPEQTEKDKKMILSDEDQDYMPEWTKFLPYYKLPDIYLDNKLEELLNIFGRRQCKSCIEFATGTELQDDLRRTRSYPLSPRGEALYAGMDGEFNLVDFQIQNNVYAEAAEPTQMFSSVARDFSDFGVQVFAFDVLKALNRKGGDLVNPSIDDADRTKKDKKKQRGRKNKYYRQIDDEDDQEANHHSGSDNDALANIREEDDEDEDEAEKRRREAQREKIRREEQEQAEKLKAEQALLAKQQDEAQKNRAANEAAEKKRREAEEAERKKKEEADRKKKEKEDAERKKKEEADQKKREKEEAERKKKEEDELKKKEEAEKKKKAEAEKLAKEKADKEAKAKAAKAIPDDKSQSSHFSEMKVQKDALNQMKAQMDNQIVEVPPNADSRNFNELDILGEFERDSKGNVIISVENLDAQKPEEIGYYKDKRGSFTNQRGYLIDPKTGGIINNHDGRLMFNKNSLDEKGEVPGPFNFDKYNFNPHRVRGDFDYDRNGRPIINKDKNGNFVDKRGNKVTSRGYRIDDKGNIIDIQGRKKFHRAHLTPEGDLPKLFNYNGRRFDVTDCIGLFDKDQKGNFIPLQNKSGHLVDKLGRKVNSKGYLVDDFGNVIDKDGRQLFELKHLENDEIPKIFPFTKFNVKNVMGEFEMDPLGVPILDKDKNGNLLDNQGRIVNSKGYLIDKDGNVIDKNGRMLFKKKILDEDGDIPKVFRTGLLKSDTASSLSRLMSEIEKNQPSEFENEENRIQQEIERNMAERRKKKGGSGDTSIDSMMEDTPANYNMQNQRYIEGKGNAMNNDMDDQEYDDEVDDYGDQVDAQGLGGMGAPFNAKELAKKRKKKKKKRVKPVQYEDPSLREHLLAGAYGGVAKPKPKRQGVKYTTDLDAGLRDIATPNAMKGGERRHMYPIQGSLSGLEGQPLQESARKRYRSHVGGGQSSAHRSNQGSQIGSKQGLRGPESSTKLMDPAQREARLKEKQLDEIKRKQIAREAAKRRAQKKGKLSKDADFEKMFGKDIDEFLEDSEWDIESMDKMSAFSKQSKKSINSVKNGSKLKGLEKVYLQRIETTGQNKNALQNTGEKISMGQTGSSMMKKAQTQDRHCIKEAKFRDMGDH